MYRSSDIYENIVKVIIEIFLDYDIKDFPIDEKDICRRLGVALVPYSEFHKEARALLEKKSKYGFFVMCTKENPPTIYYNDKFEPYGAVRLTILHEFKHYLFDEDANDEDQDDLADFFGRYFLCSIPYLIMKGIDTENEIISHCGVSGFDLSPSIGMLRPRQRLSILVNAIHACYLGTKGIKILPNYRAGDFGTLCAADYFPDECSFIVGNLGCTNNRFKAYGEYQLDIVLQKKNPSILFVYGSIFKREAARLIRQYGFEIISFPDRRNRVRNNSRSYRYYLSENEICKVLYADAAKRRTA